MSTPPLRTVDIEVNAGAEPAHVDLACIFAGALLSTAVALLFTTFGSAIGLTMLSPYRGEGASGTMFIVAIGIWTMWVAVSSTMAGGYLAGRLRKRSASINDHEVEIRDGLHGLAVWAVAMLLGAFVAATVTAGAAKAAHRMAGSAVEAMGGGRGMDMADLLNKPDSGRQIGATAERLVRAPQNASPREVLSILSRSAAGGELRADDRQYLADLVASRTGRTPAEAGTLVDEAYAETQQLIERARVEAEKARKVAVLVAFLTAASLLAAGVGAWWAATRGGRHRDTRTDFSRLTHWED